VAISKQYIEKTRAKAAGWYSQAGLNGQSIETLEGFSLPQKQDEPWRYFQPHRFIESALLLRSTGVSRQRLLDGPDR